MAGKYTHLGDVNCVISLVQLRIPLQKVKMLLSHGYVVQIKT